MKWIKLSFLFCFMVLAQIAWADDVRTPVVKLHPTNVTLRPTGNTEDTYIVQRTSFLAVYYADTQSFISTKGDSASSSGWFVASGQYYPDPVLYRAGDTIVAKCLTCGSDTTIVRIRLYQATDR